MIALVVVFKQEEAQTLAKIFTDIINNEHEGVSLPFADSAGLPNLGGAKIELLLVT